ncbi:MAG: cytochrome c-type biogenesis protein [Pseudomonadota bacterium]
MCRPIRRTSIANSRPSLGLLVGRVFKTAIETGGTTPFLPTLLPALLPALSPALLRALLPAFLAVLLAAVLIFDVRSASAVIETYEFSNSELEARYHRLSQELRCPKCQNQNIADSNAPISQDLRQLLFRQLEGGASDEQILDDMVSRYGEFVRYRPSAQGATLWLWLAPALLLVLALLILVTVVRRHSSAAASAPIALNAQQRERMQELRSQDGGGLSGESSGR